MALPTDAYASSQQWLGGAIEATRGASVAATFWPPFMDPKWSPKVTWLKDAGMRGSPVKVYDQVPGPRNDEMTWKGNVHLDTFPNLLRAILGSPDTATSVGGGLYTHKIGLLNSPSVGSQPPSYTWTYFDGYTYRILSGQQGSDLHLTSAMNAAFTYEWTSVGQPAPTPYGTTATNTPPTTDHIIPNWATAASIGGVQMVTLETFDVDIKRGTEPIVTNTGTQGPYRVWAAECDVTGKLGFVLTASDTTLAYGLARQQQIGVFTWTDQVSSHTLALTMSAMQLEDPVITVGKSYVEIEANFTAIADTTDQVTGGYSPISSLVTNAQTTQY